MIFLCFVIIFLLFNKLRFIFHCCGIRITTPLLIVSDACEYVHCIWFSIQSIVIKPFLPWRNAVFERKKAAIPFTSFPIDTKGYMEEEACAAYVWQKIRYFLVSFLNRTGKKIIDYWKCIWLSLQLWLFHLLFFRWTFNVQRVFFISSRSHINCSTSQSLTELEKNRFFFNSFFFFSLVGWRENRFTPNIYKKMCLFVNAVMNLALM